MKVLIVVDMQNDFIDGALGTSMAASIVPKVSEKIKDYRESGDVVIFTRDTHFEDYLSTQEGRNLPITHCVKDTYGWQISDKLEVGSSKVIDKLTFGSFELCEHLLSLGKVDEIELVGLCTDICVISNAMLLKARFLETPIFVDSTCCAGVSEETHETALEAMKMCQICIKY